MPRESLVMTPSPNASFEDALKRARDFFGAKESEQRTSNSTEPFGCGDETSPAKGFLTHSPSFEVHGNVSTPEEYKRRLQQQRLSDIILNSPPGRIQWPSQHLSFNAEPEPDSTTATTNLAEDQSGTSEERANVLAAEPAEEKLRAEAAKMRAMEEREIVSLYEDADREAQREHGKFLKRYTELQDALDAQYRRDEERIITEIAERRQTLIVKARRDSGLLAQLHKTLSEKSAESAKVFAAKSKEILELAEKAKREEEQILLQKKLQILRENNKKKFAEAVSSIDKSISTLQQDLPESQSAREQLVKVRTSLLDPANLEKTSILEEALAEIKNVLDIYAAALAEREEKKAEELKAPPKPKPQENRYLQAVEKLKRSTERFTKFIGENKTLRGNIMRFVQLTVNKIQKQTNNQEHALSFVKLFSNDPVPVGIGNETVCLAGFSDAPSYSMDLTAKKILDNVEKLPSDPIQEWVPYATVIATLWSMSPKFGEIFYDNLVSRCPFLVPFYFSDLTEEESLAYVSNFVHYKNESWSTFIKRMGYYSRLLGVISTMKPRWGPPFPPGKMWALMAGTVKCELKTKEFGEVAAMVMKSLLETSGHTMKASYERQFTKFTHLMCTEYIEKLRKIAKNAPTVVSLEIFMKEVIAAQGNYAPIG